MLPETCPQCKVSLIGDEIPEPSRFLFGGAAHFSRVIGLELGDRVIQWQCPDCHAKWPRTEDLGKGIRTYDVEFEL